MFVSPTLALFAALGGPPADLVVVNARIWTVNPAQPEAAALAAWRGRIIAIGSDDDVRKLAGPVTRVVDLHGRRVVPGFFDSHVHLLGSGQSLSEVALKDCADEAEFGKRLKEFDRKLPAGRWLTGGEWDHDRTFGGKLPTAAILDKYIPSRPAFLRRYDGHMALANSKALQMAGVGPQTPEKPGGIIYRHPGSKTPTGLLRDNAMGLVDRIIPPPNDDEVVEAVRVALESLRQNGVTSVDDMDGSDRATRQKLFRVYQRLARAGLLTCRVNLRWPIGDYQELAALGAEADFGNDFVRVGGVKGFMDGSLGSSTAKMFEPFLNEPDSTGVYVTAPDHMRELVLGADKAGLSVAVHAIGDRANAVLLDIFEETARKNGPRDRRFRIEHAQHLRPVDYKRFHELGVVASMQPYHAIDDGRWAEGRIGAARCASSYAFRSLLDAQAKLAFGSDWSVAPISALLGIDAAVNRRTLDGKNPSGWFPDQKITVEQSIEAYTRTAAYASFQDKERGSLEPGKFADFVVVSRDILAPAERDRIAETKVLLTVVGGAIVYENNEHD
jgi:predicted amidohydrolase YtcJ